MREASSAAVTKPSQAAECRRPARGNVASLSLIQIVREFVGAWMVPRQGHAVDHTTADELHDSSDDSQLAPRGIAIAILFAIPIWGALAFIVGWLVRAY